MNKQVMLFSGSKFYPEGGWEDFRGYFDSVNDAKKFLEDNWETFDLVCYPWAHIIEDNKIVLKGTLDDGFRSIQKWEFELV